MRRRSRNRRRDLRNVAPRFDPAFWEVPLDPERERALRQEDRLWYESGAEREERLARREREPLLVDELRRLMSTALTERQRQVVERYFLAHLTEEEVAAELGIARQVVNQHLYGIRRGGRRVGGAIARLRKEAQRHGLDW